MTTVIISGKRVEFRSVSGRQIVRRGTEQKECCAVADRVGDSIVVSVSDDFPVPVQLAACAQMALDLVELLDPTRQFLRDHDLTFTDGPFGIPVLQSPVD